MLYYKLTLHHTSHTVMFDGVVVDPADPVEAPPLGHGPYPPPLRRVRIEHQHILRGRPAGAAEPTTCELELQTKVRNHGEGPY